MRSVRWVLIALVVVALLYASSRFSGAPSIATGSTLMVELSGDYIEGVEPPIFGQLFGIERRSLVSALSELRKAERDDRITNVLITVRGLQVGWAKAEELRDAIRSLREAGRHPVAYLEVEGFGANRDYYVASAAEKVYMAPGSGAPLIGLAEEHWFLGGLWDRIGVSMQSAQAGRYKGAVESLVGSEMNEYYREQAERLLDSLDGLFVGGIAEARGVPVDTVRKVIATAPSRPEVLEALKMIDGVRTKAALIDELGGPDKLIEPSDYAAVDIASLGFDPRATFALIYGAGTIQSGKGSMSRTGQPIFASETVIGALQDAAKDDAIRAIVLRIDSPGGGAFPSEQIWQAIREARKKKPIVASFSDYAASGGYYLASAADVIVADPGTLTGSIGVFAVRPSIQGVLERFDVHPYTLRPRAARRDQPADASALARHARLAPGRRRRHLSALPVARRRGAQPQRRGDRRDRRGPRVDRRTGRDARTRRRARRPAHRRLEGEGEGGHRRRRRRRALGLPAAQAARRADSRGAARQRRAERRGRSTLGRDFLAGARGARGLVRRDRGSGNRARALGLDRDSLRRRASVANGEGIRRRSPARRGGGAAGRRGCPHRVVPGFDHRDRRAQRPAQDDRESLHRARPRRRRHLPLRLRARAATSASRRSATAASGASCAAS